MKQRRRFGFICISLTIFFWIGTLFFLRRTEERPTPPAVVQTIPVTKKEDIPQIPVAHAEQVNLDVPFTSQAPEKNWDEPWQDACEEAAVLMMDAYLKGYGLSPLFAKDEILKMVVWEEARGWGVSVSAEQIAQLMKEYAGLKNVRIQEDPTVLEIKAFVARGKPVLVVADGKALPNPHFRNGGPVYHALTIRGYTEDSFITNDPGTQFGENFLYKYDDLMRAIHDWNDGDVKEGEPVVLVVE